jgi:hypothetical protein
MIRYSDEKWSELVFTGLHPHVEKRDSQWVDVELRLDVSPDTPLPDDVIGLTIVAVCTHQGHPLQLVTLEEGCDSEYQLTEGEKQQINEFIRTESIQSAIRSVVK